MASSSDTVVVSKADFQNVSVKLEKFMQELKSNEKEIIFWMMQLAGWSPSFYSPHLKYKPRGAKHLAVGGYDGLTILFSRSGIKIIPPEGPLPTDFIGAAFVPSENMVISG